MIRWSIKDRVDGTVMHVDAPYVYEDRKGHKNPDIKQVDDLKLLIKNCSAVGISEQTKSKTGA